ncbi:MAG TPA: site-specific DNA-methyltransferase [Methylomirabilota bacterium]|nr:site-specific DNA-methyltransferase [Methylomirabilota bacterium]
MARTKSEKSTKAKLAKNYRHPESESLMRPEVGTQAQFKKKLPPKKYRYDDSLSPSLEWDGQNPARDQGETAIREILEAQTIEQAKVAAAKLKAISRPFLNWAGKAERLSFDVPTLPLFIHERLSTKAILETLRGHRRDKQIDMLDLFGDPQRSITDQVLRAYEHKDKWVNRMILGDSLVVMNSLLHYEGLGGQAQMIYIDPPYGVKFGSNFQPFVRKRDVTHGDDEDMTREPEMVQAYRDTWELGLHSYLTYLRDRLLLARDLLHPSGSVFVQISDENLHHVRELLDEVFGPKNSCGIIAFNKTSGSSSELLPTTVDYLLWFAKVKERVKFQNLYADGPVSEEGFDYCEFEDGTICRLDELDPNEQRNYRRFELDDSSSQGEPASGAKPYRFQGKDYYPTPGRHFSHDTAGMDRLVALGYVMAKGDRLFFKSYLDMARAPRLGDVWLDTQLGGYKRRQEKLYVVQTASKVIQRCVLMTTGPGDLVLDPTCGSGTTAYVAEQWGRRWITIDTSRVPLALARQRLLTATYPWYELQDESRGPAGGFVYKRKQNKKGEEIGGIIPHITLKSIAKSEPPEEVVLVDKPEQNAAITRVSGPFCVEATIPTPMDWQEGAAEKPAAEPETQMSFVDRMLEVLRRSPVLRLEGNKTITLKNVRRPAKTLSLSAEAMVDATALRNGATLADAVQEAEEKNGVALPLSQKPVAIVFGPENGAVSEKLVYEAAREAHAKSYARLFVIGFAIQPNARLLVDQCSEVVGIHAAYIQATPDIMMGDLLKNMRSSQIFSVCGLPEIELRKVKSKEKTDGQMYEVELQGLDVFDPVTMENHHRKGEDVPSWFLDTDYNGLCFHVSQAFFPRTGAWENLKKALKGEYGDTVWDHLAGTVSAPFCDGLHKTIAVKVIDDRGNELMVVRSLSEGK